MLNSKQFCILIILLELFVATYTAWNTDQNEYVNNVFKERRHKARQLFDTIAKKRTFSKKSQSNTLLDKPEDYQLENMKRNIPITAKKWPGGLIPYELSAEYSEDRKKVIVAAMKELSDKTSNCITFTPRVDHPHWILVQRGSACNSFIGLLNIGSQAVNMKDECGLKEIQHELLHAAGFEHEQQRPDRDKYVRIIYDNIQPESRNQFTGTSATNHFMLDEPYDFGSIMHYGYNFFSLTDQPVMVPADGVSKEWRYNMANGTGLSPRDIRLVKKYYGCPL